jgi:choline dehydrogenase
LCEAFLAGARQNGIAPNPDYNGAVQDGVGYTQSMIHRGRRWSTAHAFLHPARKAHGTRVLTNATVSRILFDGRRAAALEYHTGDASQAQQVKARREVLVCAGAIHSPKLLQLSGVGPAALLQEHGIPVVAALDGVGENLRDHYCPRIVARARPGVDSINRRVRGLPLVRELAAWALNRPSILSISPILLYAFCRSTAAQPSPDFVLSFISASYAQGRVGEVDGQPGMTCGAWQLRPQSQGQVRLRSADFREAPLIQPNYLSHETDREVVVNGLRRARAVFATEPMQRVVQAELLPGPDVHTDDELLDYARQYGVTGYHVSGTCRMGPAADKRAVVDANLKVHGLDGLRVIDASVMPTIPSANICAATMMVAEKAADLLLASARSH